MSLNIEDEFAVNLLKSFKQNSSSKKKPREEWNNYVKEVRKEMISKSEKPVSYIEARSEASKRRRIQNNISDLNKARKERVENNRRSVKFQEESEIFIIDSDSENEAEEPEESKSSEEIEYYDYNNFKVQVVYTFKIIHNSFIEFSSFSYEKYKDCLVGGLLHYLDKYSEFIAFTLFDTTLFKQKTYKEVFSDNLKLFFNSWIFDQINLVFDKNFKDLIVKINYDMLNKFTIPELEYLCFLYKTVVSTQDNKCPYLLITTNGLVKA
jgi:hypothetical protein